MKKINSFAVSQLHVASHVDFHKAVIMAMITASFSQTAWRELREAYNQAVTVLQEVVRRQQSSALTAKIREADARRDNAMRQLFKIIDAAALSFDENQREAGRVLKQVVKKYRRDVYDQYTDQTEQIYGLIRDLSTQEISEYVNAAKAGPIIQPLRTANNEFVELYEQRAVEQEQRPGHGIDTVAQRRVVDGYYRQMCELVNGLSAVSAVDAETGFDPTRLATLIETVNALVAQYKRVIAHQGKRHKTLDGEITDSASHIAVLHDELVVEEHRHHELEQKKKEEIVLAAEHVIETGRAQIAQDDAPLLHHDVCDCEE